MRRLGAHLVAAAERGRAGRLRVSCWDARGRDGPSPSASRSAAAAAPAAAGAVPAAAACTSYRARAARAGRRALKAAKTLALPILNINAWRAVASRVADHTSRQPQSVATAGRRLFASNAPGRALRLAFAPDTSRARRLVRWTALRLEHTTALRTGSQARGGVRRRTYSLRF